MLMSSTRMMIALKGNLLIAANLLLLLPGILSAQSRPSGTDDYLKLPDYVEVVKQFYGTYSIESLPPRSDIRIEKKRTGWHIAQRNAIETEMETVQSYLFWSLEKKKYLKLKFKKLKKKERAAALAAQFPLPYNKRYFRICPYYGYPGWDRDVIADFKNAENLPDSLVLALGRAYSSYASNLIHSNSGFADKSVQYKLKDGKNCLNDEQLQSYRFYTQRSIEQFEKLAAMDSLYECLVGPIKYKLANEYLTAFLFLRVYQNEEEAYKQLKKGIYDKGLLENAKNYLNSCAEDAILFTNGDNDTFPLLYLQAFLGIRQDVLVVNLSLLNTHRYINSLRDSIPGAHPLELSFDREDYANHVREYLHFYGADTTGTMDLGEVLDFVQSESMDAKIKAADGSYRNYLPTRSLSLKVDTEMVLGNGTVTDGLQNEIVDEIEWDLRGDYILRNKMIVLDIIHKNAWKRPIYFALTVGTDGHMGLEHYLQLEGLAFRLVPLKKKRSDGRTEGVHSSILYVNLLHKFEWSGMENNSTMERIAANYKNTFARLADQLIEEGRRDSAILVLDHCVAVMPDELIAYNYFNLPIAELYYRLDQSGKANLIVRRLTNRYTKQLQEAFAMGGGRLDSEARKSMKYDMAVLTRLLSAVKKYKQESLTKELQKAQDVFMPKYQVWLDKIASEGVPLD